MSSTPAMQPHQQLRSKLPLEVAQNAPQSCDRFGWPATSSELPTTTTASPSRSGLSHPFPPGQQAKGKAPFTPHYSKLSTPDTAMHDIGDRYGRLDDDVERHQKATDTNQEFERLMDELQIPPSVRLKVSPLDTPMKESLLISFRAQANSQRAQTRSAFSNHRPGHMRAQSVHPDQVNGQASDSPAKRGRENLGSVGLGLPLTPHIKGGKHIKKAQSSSSLRSPSGIHASQSKGGPDKPPPLTPQETQIVNNSKFIMVSTAHSPSKSSFFGNVTPAPPPMTKRYTVDGIQLPPCLPGDEDLHATHSNSSGDSVSKAASKAKRKSRGRGFSFGASSANTDGTSSGKRSSWFGSRSRDASSNGHIGSVTFPASLTASDGVFPIPVDQDMRPRSRARSKSRASQDLGAGITGSGKGIGATGSKKWTPTQWAEWIKLEDTFKMGVERTKTLRMLLRHESTEWIEAFLTAGGYEYLLRRLEELLKVEWRTEQHDDKLLYELLRCVKALSTLEIGKQALVAHGASPFRQLADLLYSDKKPGDLASRQVILELFHSVLSLRPSVSVSNTSSPMESTGPSASSLTSSSSTGSKAPNPMLRNRSSYINMRPVKPEDTSMRGTVLVLDLLRSKEDLSSAEQKCGEGDGRVLPFLSPASELPAPKVDMHDFLSKVHVEKPYKTYLRELSDVCRDYYWIMCHGENNIWTLADVDKRLIKPQAPSGATGGVEFEAVYYITSHFRLLNSLGRALAQQDMLDPQIRMDRRRGVAFKLHSNLFASGMDRILATIRKASVDFYTEFHLELALFVELAREAGVQLPYVVEKLLGPPPEKFRRFEAFPGDTSAIHIAAPVGEWLPPPRSWSAFNVQA